MKQLNSALKLFFLIFSVCVLNYGCKKATDSQPELASPKLADAKSSTMFLTENNLGKKLANPYAVANMRKALANLATKGDVQKVTNLINTSHYYLKFMPKNEAEFALLKVDSNLVIYPFPLDVVLSTNGSTYREPGLPAGMPTYQYAAVPVGYKLPKVSYEVLAHLYLPNERNLQAKVAANGLKAIGAPEVSVKDLVNEAENIACETPIEVYRNGVVVQLLPGPGFCDGGEGGEYGGGSSGGGGSNCGAPSGEWRPSGRITMTDDVLGLIGVEGLKIRARRWFTTYVGFTDANGNYCVDGTFTRPANYWFDFERYDFSVNDHRGGPREISGPKQEAAWNLDLTGYNKFCATIFRAAFHYYHKDIQGLRRPPQNSFWATQLKIAAFDWYQVSDNGDMWPGRNLLLGSLIHVYRPQRPSDEIYATTIHELAHAVHWDMYPHDLIGTFTATSNKVRESWATGVQWSLTKMVYHYYVGRYCGHGEAYTNVIMDMIDPYDPLYSDPYDQHHGFSQYKDLVEGYSIVQIQDAIYGQTSWEGWKNNIINNYSNGTEQNMDALFNNWYNW